MNTSTKKRVLLSMPTLLMLGAMLVLASCDQMPSNPGNGGGGDNGGGGGSDTTGTGGGSDEATVTYNFEDGTAQGWTFDDAEFAVKDDQFYSDSYSIGTTTENSTKETVASIEPTELGDEGNQITSFSYYYRETTDNTGAGIRLLDASGDMVVATATGNPNYNTYGADGFTAYGQPTSSDYDVWVKVQMAFDWQAGIADITFTDTESDASETHSVDLAKMTGISRIEIANYHSAESGGFYVSNSGAFYYWVDDISFTTGDPAVPDDGGGDNGDGNNVTINGDIGIGADGQLGGGAPSYGTYSCNGDIFVGPNGDDSNSGTSRNEPLASMSKATNMANPGDVVAFLPGTYTGKNYPQRYSVGYKHGFDFDKEADNFNYDTEQVVVCSEQPYQAKLTRVSENVDDRAVVSLSQGYNITIKGFEIYQTGTRHDPGGGYMVFQIQDGLGSAHGPSDGKVVKNIVLRNNIFHDAYSSDILKIGNGATDIVIEGNIFYNQTGHDEHIDLNSGVRRVVQDNIFFNDFAGSGRTDYGDTGSFIVDKDSDGNNDDFVGTDEDIIRRNILLNWAGSNGSYFLQIGSDNRSYHSVNNAWIASNLMIGNSNKAMRAPMGVSGSKNIVWAYNTVVGDLPSYAYGTRVLSTASRPNNIDIQYYGNMWDDPTGTMGAEKSAGLDFFGGNPGDIDSFTIDGNLYWNGGTEVPDNGPISKKNDANAVVADPVIQNQSNQGNITVPIWNQSSNQFADGSTTIREAFKKLVNNYGVVASGSPAVSAGVPNQAIPNRDILGNTPNASSPTLGASSQ